MTFTIEKNIPTPHKVGNAKYPFPDMEIGDSFSVARDMELRIRAASRLWGKHHDAKFITRKNGDGFRVWRTA